MEDTFKQEDFDQVITLEGAIAKALFPFAANTPTRLAIFALARVLKVLLRKCDPPTRQVYVSAIVQTLDAPQIVKPGAGLGNLERFFH